MYKYHVWVKNKPIYRTINAQGKYESIKTSHHSGHGIFDTIEDAIAYIQDAIRKDWDVQMEVVSL